MASIGIMDPAYFVGRKELLAWINEFLALDYTKVEQMASGAAYVQLMDAAFPGQIPLSKANFNASYDYEFSSNFKILQTHFVKIKCDKVVPTDRLIRGKYQDNLEFMQWCKRFFEMQYNGEPYDAKARRKECKCEYAGDKSSASKPKAVSSSSSSAATSSASDGRRASMMPGTGTTTKPVRQSVAPARTTTTTTSAGSRVSAAKQARDNRVDELTEMCAEMTIELGKAETTRDFYYGKLRAIENLMANLDVSAENVEDLRDKVNNILFSADESPAI